MQTLGAPHGQLIEKNRSTQGNEEESHYKTRVNVDAEF